MKEPNMKNTSVMAGILAIGLLVGTAALAQVSVETSVGIGGSAEVSAPAVSSALGDASSAVSNVSSQMSSALDSSNSSQSSMNSSQSSMTDEQNCSDLASNTGVGSTMDADMLAAVTSVTVLSVGDCSGLPEATAAGTYAQVAANPLVVEALAANGQDDGEIVAYTIDGTSLTLYVRSND
jgi:hypothetical protein